MGVLCCLSTLLTQTNNTGRLEITCLCTPHKWVGIFCHLTPQTPTTSKRTPLFQLRYNRLTPIGVPTPIRCDVVRDHNPYTNPTKKFDTIRPGCDRKWTIWLKSWWKPPDSPYIRHTWSKVIHLDDLTKALEGLWLCFDRIEHHTYPYS